MKTENEKRKQDRTRSRTRYRTKHQMNGRENNLLKRGFSLFLCLVMCLTMLPEMYFTVKADDRFLADIEFFVLSEEDGHCYDTLDITVETSDGSYYERQNCDDYKIISKGSNAFFDVPVLEGKEGTTTVTAYVQARRSDDRIKAVKMAITKDMLVKNGDHYDMTISVKRRQANDPTGIIKIGGMSTLNDDLVVTDEAGNELTTTYWITDAKDTEISGSHRYDDTDHAVKEICLEFPDELQAGQKLYIHDEWNNNLWDAEVTLDENKSAVLNGYDDISWFVKPDIGVWCNTHTGEEDYGTGTYGNYTYLGLCYQNGSLMEDSLRLMRSGDVTYRRPPVTEDGSYTVLIMLASAYALVGEEQFATLEKAESGLAALATDNGQAAEDMYALETFEAKLVSKKEVYLGQAEVENVWINCDIPKGTISQAKLFCGGELVLPESTGGALLAEHEYGVKFYTRSVITDYSGNAVLRLNYNHGQTEEKEIFVDNQYGYDKYRESDGRLKKEYRKKGAFPEIDVLNFSVYLPTDAETVESIQVQFGDISYEVPVNRTVKPYIGVSFDGSSLPRRNKMLTIKNAAGKIVDSKNLGRDALAEGLYVESNALENGDYTISVTGEENGKRFEYGSTNVTIEGSTPVKATVFLTAVDPADIMPVVKNASGETGIQYRLNWYEDAEGTKYIGSENHLVIAAGETVYVQAIPMGQDVVSYLPTELLPVTASDEKMPVILPESPKVTVSGKVAFDDNKGSTEGFLVNVTTTMKGYSVSQSVDTAKDGSFTLENVTFFDEEEGKTVLMVADMNIEQQTMTLKSGETEDLALTVKRRQGIIQVESVNTLSLTNAAGEDIPFMKSGSRLYLHDPSQVSQNETLTINTTYLDKSGSTRVVLDEEKSGVADPFTWSYRSRVHIRFDNPYRQSVVMLLYRDGELVDKNDYDGSLVNGIKAPEYWGNYLEAGSYTYVFVNKGTYQMLTEDAMRQYEEALNNFDAIGKKQYVTLEYEVSENLKNSETREESLSMPMGVPPMSEINMEASSVSADVKDDTIDVRITVAPMDNTTDKKSAVINVYTDQKTTGGGKVINDPDVIKGSLYINGHRVTEDELERGFNTYVENITMKKDVFERQAIHGEAASFDGYYQFAIKDVTKYGGWPLTIRYTSGRTDVEKVNLSATVSLSLDNKNQRMLGSVEKITPALTFDAQEQIGSKYVFCNGMGPKNSEITIYVDGVANTVVKSNYNGYYSTNIWLKDAYYQQTYVMQASAKIDGKAYYSEPFEVNYNSVNPYIVDYGYIRYWDYTDFQEHRYDPSVKYMNISFSMNSFWKNEVSYLYYWPPLLEDVGIAIGNLEAYEDPGKAVYDVKLCIPLNDSVIEIPAHFVGCVTYGPNNGYGGDRVGLWIIDRYPLGYTAPNDMYITYKVATPDYDMHKSDRDALLQELGDNMLAWNQLITDNKVQLRNYQPFTDSKDITVDLDKFSATNFERTAYTGKIVNKFKNVIGTATKKDGSTVSVNESFEVTEQAGTTYGGKTATQLIEEWKKIANPLVEDEKERTQKLIDTYREYFSEEAIAFLERYKEDIKHCYRDVGGNTQNYYIEEFEWYTIQGGDELWLYAKMDMDTFTCVLCESKSGTVIVDTYKRVFEKGKGAYPDYEDEDMSPFEQVQLRWIYVLEALNDKVDEAAGVTKKAEANYDADGQSVIDGLIGKLYYGGTLEPLPRAPRERVGLPVGQGGISDTDVGHELLDVLRNNHIGDGSDGNEMIDRMDLTGANTYGGVRFTQSQIWAGGNYIKNVNNIVQTATGGAKGGGSAVIKAVMKNEGKIKAKDIYERTVGGERRSVEARKQILSVYAILKDREVKGHKVDWTGFPHTEETQRDYLEYVKSKNPYRKNNFKRRSNTRVAVDPSGYIYAGVKSNRISDVTAKIYEVDDNGNCTLWNATEFAQNNPYVSDEKGIYQWMVPTGKWSVTFEKEGYETYITGENDGYGAAKAGETWYMPVFPEQLDVNINLQALEAPKVISCEADKATRKVFVVFDQYMDIETLVPEQFTLVENTINKIPVTEEMIAYPDAEENDGKVYARTVRILLPENVEGDNTVLRIDRQVTSYTGKTMDSAYESEKLVPVRVDQTAAPVMNIEEGELETNTIITLTCDTPDAKIFYTVDGSEPTTSSKLYTEEIAMTGTMDVRAIAVAPGREASEVTTAAYSIAKAQQPDIPQYTVGDVSGDGEVDIADALLISRYDAGLTELDDTAILAADVNGDGVADIADALMISRYDAGLITEFKTVN